MANIYVARKRLQIAGQWREPGEEVPEAAGWRNLHSYLSSGAVVLVQTDTEHSYGMKQRIPTEPDVLDWKPEPVKSTRYSHDQLAGWGNPATEVVPVKLRIRKSTPETETKDES
jgi:hypothetical protein